MSPTLAALTRIPRVLLMLCAGATALYACPMYSDECDGRDDCASGYYCETFSRRCQRVVDDVGCVQPDQCEVGETCTPDFICRPGSCDYHGCVRGFRCAVVDTVHTCVPALEDAGADAATEPADAATDPADAAADASASDAAAGELTDASP